MKAAIEELQWVEYAERSVKLQALAHGHGPLHASTDSTGERRVTLGRILVGFNGQTIAERELTPGRFIIGRTPDNDLQIDSKYISRHHAQIITSASTSVLEDLNSTNGIYVRAKRVRRRMLNDGDVVQIGQHEIMYFDERLSRTRVLPGEGEDDAVPLVQDGKQSTADTDDDDEDAPAPMPVPIRADRK
jgi:predicted component of type VI protein secretion system